ncbi:LysE family translocator [bacterium AH-315-K03]|nr:LysE family translocator [bacterium AH-315-K03]
MMEYFFLLPISLALFVGVVSPGPSFLLIAQTAVAKSRSDAIATSVGLGVGAAVFALVASAGLYVVLESVPWVYVFLKVIGGLYLCFLAYKIWISAQVPMLNDTTNQPCRAGVFRSFFVGLFTQLSNPKTAVVFMGVFAAFLPEQVPSNSYLFVCLLAFIIDASWYCLVSVVLSTKKAQRTYSKYKFYISRVAGGFMGFMGLKLASNQ